MALTILPTGVSDDELDDIQGTRVTFPGKDPGQIFGDTWAWNSWHNDPKGEWFVPERLCGSYYSGGFVNLANYQGFIEEWSEYNDFRLFYVELYGGHSTYGVALYIPGTPREVWELLLRLENYPCADDERLSQLETEAGDEAWESWAKDEYKKLWADWDYTEGDYPEDWMDLVDDDEWAKHFYEVVSASNNISWEPQGDTQEVSIDVQKVFDAAAYAPDYVVPSGAAPAPPAADPAEPPPKGNWTPGQIREFKRRGLRQGYDFNPGPPNYVGTPPGINAFLAADPYQGVRVTDRFDDFPVSRGGLILNNVTHDQSPHERAILLLDNGPSHEIVMWRRNRIGGYTVLFIDPKSLPKPITTVGKAGKLTDGLERKGYTIDEDDWGIVLRSLARGAHSSGHDAAAVYVRWYDDSGEEPRLEDYDTDLLVMYDVSPTELITAYAEVFDVFDQREKSVNEVMGLLGMRGSLPEEPPAAAVLAPPGEDERRRRHLDYLREQLDRPYVRRFEPNHGPPLFIGTPPGLNAFLGADPYQGVVIPFRSACSVQLRAGTIQQNVTHDQDPSDRAILLLSTAGGPVIVAWWRYYKGTPGEYYNVVFLDPEEFPKGLKFIAVIGRVQEHLEANGYLPSEDDWDTVLRALKFGGSWVVRAIWLRWYDDTGLTPRVQDMFPGVPSMRLITKVGRAELADAYQEVFDVYDQRVQSVSEVTEPGARASEEAPRQVPTDASAPAMDDRRRQQLDYLREQMDRPYVRRFDPNPPLARGTGSDVWLDRFLSSDPYVGVVVSNKPATASGLMEPGTILHNGAHDEDPAARAFLLMNDMYGNPFLVLWKRPQGSDHYTMVFLDPHRLPLEFHGHAGTPSQTAVLLRLYDDDRVEPRIWNLPDSAPATSVRLVPYDALRMLYSEVFETYDQVGPGPGARGRLLSARDEQTPTEAQPTFWVDDPERERPPRREYPPRQLEAFKAKGLRQGYDFNPKQSQHPSQFDAGYHPFEDFLENDPFRSLLVTGNKKDLFSIPGRVVHNVAWDDSVYDRAMLLIRESDKHAAIAGGPPQVYLTCWWLYDDDDEFYTVTLFQLHEIIRRGAKDWDPRVQIFTELSKEAWEYLTERLERTPVASPVLALYYRLWDDAELKPRLWETAALSDLADTWEKVPLERLKAAYPEVFAGRPVRVMEPLESMDVTPFPAAAAEPEREPRFKYSEGAIRAFKAKGLRPGYDFNPALAEGMGPEQFDPVELAVGTETELEHTDNVAHARAIAMDHLVEDAQYYQKLRAAGL